MTDDQQRREWHLDRRVTVTLIFALLVQAASTIWFAAKLDQRVATIENTQVRSVEMPERITRVETRLDGLNISLDRIERKLDRAIEGGK